MPSFSSSSSIRAASEHCLLNIKIVHKLYHGSPSNVVHKVKGRLPKELDVLLLSDLIVSISGSLDGQTVPADSIAHSALVRHLRSDLNEARIKATFLLFFAYVFQNAPQLGLNNVSDAYIDDDDGHTKIILTPSRSLSHTSRPHATLVAVDLCYIWKTAGDREGSTNLLSDASPFADHLYLPFELLLKRVTEQLFSQLVGRYPLIFGTWRRRLDMESEYFHSVAQSILEIMRRSPNPHFVVHCKRLIKTARARHQSVLQASATALSLCFAPRDSEDSDEGEQINTPELTPEAVLCESLEQMFRVGVPQTRFKSQIITARLTSSAGDDDQLVEHDAIFNSTEVDFPLAWPNLPDIHMDISVPAIDIQQTVPNDTDDLLEDWPDEATTLPGAWTTHSDGFLIKGLGFSSQPRSITPPLASSYLTESEDNDSFALDLEVDHEQEDVNMEDAEFERTSLPLEDAPVVFHQPLSCHLIGAESTFSGRQEQLGEVDEFAVLVDTEFADEEWSCEDEILFDLADVFDDSSGLCVEDETGLSAVSQVPDGGPDQDNFLQVKNNTADQKYTFDTHFSMDGQVVQGSTYDCFTDVWDL
ncbi:hypothetical protein DEU56DRAFT_910145 [Suillus clintonianus]|uniref:uncharacterized protein n=1 Tax=Suillus clintonianus TaxID=1904413 RepID=UPI001B865C90|nr:uncharacterized protein DEU56DRAFT_910145 [Suillus clintonianus]KAG2145862.1 hypothetical protein DEU56DRAFT_910145 [Suillus clintonianus]